MDDENLPLSGALTGDGEVVRLPATTRASDRSSAPPRRTIMRPPAQVAFDRRELSEILRVYGHHVASGEWRDYAMDFQRDCAVFSIFKRSSEMPLYRIEKTPKLARKQGAYAVLNTNGMILKRGHELRQVLKVLEPRKHLRVVD